MARVRAGTTGGDGVVDHDLIGLARRQHGAVSRQQALAAGLSSDAIKRRVRSGAWTRLRQGVFVIGGAPPTWEQEVVGCCLAGGDDVLASHRTGARVWGIVGADGRTEVLVAGERRVRLPGVRVHQSILLPAVDRTVRNDIPVTSLARTLADVSQHQDPIVVGRWIDAAMRVHRLDPLELRSCLARLAGPGRRDTGALRTALATRLPGWDPGESDLEARALLALHRAGLPAPVQQHVVRRPDGRVARIDLAYPAERIAIELDGWGHHGRRDAFDPDRIRRNELTLLGWDVYQFTWTMADALLVATVSTALERAHRRTAG